MFEIWILSDSIDLIYNTWIFELLIYSMLA